VNNPQQNKADRKRKTLIHPRARRDAALLKDEIVENLDEFLQTNATRLSKNATFEGYYGSGRRSTPFKVRDTSAAPNAAVTSGGEEDGVKSVVKARGRKATKVKQEPE
jgi:hypothetical protein